MDLEAEFERLIESMEWSEVLETLQAMVGEMLGDATNPPPLPPSPPLPLSPTPVHGGYDGIAPLGADPHSFHTAPIIYQWNNVTQPGLHHRQAGAFTQGQYNNVPVVMLPDIMKQHFIPFGVANGEVVFGFSADSFPPVASAVPPPNASMSQKRKRTSQQNEDEPYVKKPLNAFMLFRREQRPKVVAELNDNNSARVNTVLGQRWRSLTRVEQAKYYEEAERERQLHTQRFPEWSCGDNYGKKRKRVRRRPPSSTEASEPAEVTKLCVTPVMEPSASHMTTPVHLPVYDTIDLLELFPPPPSPLSAQPQLPHLLPTDDT